MHMSGKDNSGIIHLEVPPTVGVSTHLTPGEYVRIPVSLGMDSAFEMNHSEALGVVEQSHLFNTIEVLPGIVDAEHSWVLCLVKGNKPLLLQEGSTFGTFSSLEEIREPLQSGEVMVSSGNGTLNHSESPKGDSEDPEELWSVLRGGLTEYLSDNEKDRVMEVLREHKKVFSHSEADIGYLGTVQHRIELLDSTPVYQKPRRFPEHVAEQIESQCEELLLLDVIEPSTSAWNSPLVPVMKKTGQWRLCVDYRRLNLVTKPDRFPLPNLTDSIYSLHGMKYFSCLDLIKGFYHVALDGDSKELTAFATPRGHWQFKRMPFGLRNAPAAFQREMQQVFNGYPRNNVIVYIDDVLVMHESFEGELKLMGKVLTTLENYGLKIKPDKCSFFDKEVEYLGHIVGVDGLRKSPTFIKKVAEIQLPNTVGQLREFLGLVNFQRKFVPDFSTLQKPLSEKTTFRKSKTLIWTEEMTQSFNDVKRKVCKEVLLSFPDYEDHAEPLELYVDASGVGAGACLSQRQGDDVKVIGYASTSFSSAQRHYSTIERELAALRWAVKAMRPFLIGTEFIIHTDHRPLIYLSNMKMVDSRLARTLEDLADFNYKIIYTPGRQNVAADALSRLYDPACVHYDLVESDPRKLPDGLVVMREVLGGGDSLFDSLLILTNGPLLRKTVSDSLKLRQDLVEELIKFPEKYSITLNRDTRKQLRLMRAPGQLPCVEVLYAFGQLYECAVLVHFGDQFPVMFVPPAVKGARNFTKVHLQCISGVHYNPVAELAGYSYCVEGYTVDLCRRDSCTYTCEEFDSRSDTGDPEESRVSENYCATHNRAHLTSVPIHFLNELYCALIDTGSEVSCAAVGVIHRHNIPVSKDTTYELCGLGVGCQPVEGLAALDVRISKEQACGGYHSFAVVPDAAMPYCFILGADYIKSFNLQLDLGTGVCSQGSVMLVRSVSSCNVES